MSLWKISLSSGWWCLLYGTYRQTLCASRSHLNTAHSTVHTSSLWVSWALLCAQILKVNKHSAGQQVINDSNCEVTKDITKIGISHFFLQLTVSFHAYLFQRFYFLPFVLHFFLHSLSLSTLCLIAYKSYFSTSVIFPISLTILPVVYLNAEYWYYLRHLHNFSHKLLWDSEFCKNSTIIVPRGKAW